jgi:hypothetical protein
MFSSLTHNPLGELYGLPKLPPKTSTLKMAKAVFVEMESLLHHSTWHITESVNRSKNSSLENFRTRIIPLRYVVTFS